MRSSEFKPMRMSISPTPSGRRIAINGMEVGNNVERGGIKVEWDGERGQAKVTLTFLVDDLHSVSTLGFRASVAGDPEAFCPRCFAGVRSMEHLQKCEASA